MLLIVESTKRGINIISICKVDKSQNVHCDSMIKVPLLMYLCSVSVRKYKKI